MGYNFIIEMLEDENDKTLKEIIEEKKPPNSDEYKEYPYLKYFVYTLNKKTDLGNFKKLFNEKKNNMNEFPIIYKHFSESESKEQKLKFLKFVEKYNEFCNFMIENYSFKITR